MDTETLRFEDEITVEVPKEVLYDFQLRSYQITKSEYERPDKIEIEKDGDKLIWNFDSSVNTSKKEFYFKKLNDHRTKIKIDLKIPFKSSILSESKIGYEGESGLLGYNILYKTLEFIYDEEQEDDITVNSNIKRPDRPFYFKEYSDVIDLKSDVKAIYEFLKKRYDLFEQMKDDYTTLKSCKRTTIKDEKYRYLRVKNKYKHGTSQTLYSFFHNSDGLRLELKFWVPYWKLISFWKGGEYLNTYRALRTYVKVFDEIYQEYFV